MAMSAGDVERLLSVADKHCADATPGPWFVEHTNDDYAASMVLINTEETTGWREGHRRRWPAFDATTVVAATLVQSPLRYVDIVDSRWDQNAEFIAASRDLLPAFTEVVRSQRDEIERLTDTLAEDPNS